MLAHVTIETRSVSGKEEERFSQTVRGVWDAMGEGYSLTYEEVFDNEPPTHVTVTATKTQVVIDRNGVCRSVMRFAPHTMCVCPYHTPYGVLNLTVQTDSITTRMTPQGGVLRLRYTLQTEAGERSQHQVQMTVSALTD